MQDCITDQSDQPEESLREHSDLSPNIKQYDSS